MSLDATLLRIAQLQSVLAPVPTRLPTVSAPPVVSAPGGGAAGTPFASVLQEASAAQPPAGGATSGIAGLAAKEVGQREAPMGSNDSARIAQYRSAVPGGPVGPWCAYFASWVARESGTPLGDSGQGFARVDDVWSWAERSGRAAPAGAGVTPRPGDLIIWDEHMGIVEAVNPDGSIQTIEGNSSDAVTRRTHQPGGPIVGFVRMS